MAYKLFQNFLNHFHLFSRDSPTNGLAIPVFYLGLSQANFIFEASGFFLGKDRLYFKVVNYFYTFLTLL